MISQHSPASLATRLTRTLLLALAAVWLVCIVGVSWFIFEQINKNFDNELAESGQRLIDFAVNQYDKAVAENQASGNEPIIAKDPIINTLPLTYQLVDGHGRVLLRSGDAPVQPFGVPLSEGFFNHGKWRIYVVEHPFRELYLLLADPQEERTEVLIHSLLSLVATMILVLLALSLLLRSISRRELSVLQTLQQQISQRNGTDLSPIDVSQMPRELRAVGEDVNHMLQRLSEALNVERALAANAAHELRTPLAIAMLRLQAALDGDFAREDVSAALDGLKTLAHRAEKLLQLSRAESGASLSQQVVDLTVLAQTVAQEFWGYANASRHPDLIEPESADGQTLKVLALADPDTLAIALRNLVENALRYGQGAKVEIQIESPATLIVRDYGPGVSPEQMATLEQRHVRHAKDSAGYGLGMSITTTIVQRNHGVLKLFSPIPGHANGFEARIYLTPSPSPSDSAPRSPHHKPMTVMQKNSAAAPSSPLHKP